MNRKKHSLPVWALFCIAIVFGLCAALPLWGEGMVNTRGGGDSPFLLQRTADMAENLRYGIFPPRWMAHGAYGLGYPFFNHYAALPYYISGGLTALNMDIVLAIQVTQTLGFVLAAVAVTAWARQVTRSDAAIIAIVAAYSFAPFHLVNVYVRGDSLSEFYAFVWYPLILWSLHRAVQRPHARRLILAGLCYGALVLTHNVSAVIFSPFALAYALWMTYQEHRFDKWQPYLLICVPFVLGMLYSAWFFIPALGETQYAHMGDEFTAGYFHYSNHFRLFNLVQPGLFFDFSVADVVDEAGPFSMGLVQAVFALLGLIKAILALVKRRGTLAQRHTLIFLAGGFLLATVMITPLSQPLWRYLPLLELTQFPWRFLSIQALFTAMLTGVLFMRVPTSSPHGFASAQTNGRGLRLQSECEGEKSVRHTSTATENRWLRIIGLVAVVGLMMHSNITDTLLWRRLELGTGAESWQTLAMYETFTGNIGTTIRYEYLPEAVNPRPYISEYVVDGEGRILSGSNSVTSAELHLNQPNKQKWSVTLSANDVVSFPLYWWPGWHAQVEGQDVDAYAFPGSGRLTLDLSAGEHAVELTLQNMTVQTLGIAISLTSIIVSAVVAVLDKAPWPKITVQAVIVLCLVIVLSLALPMSKQTARASSAPFFDFDSIPFPHAGPVGFPDSTLYEVRLDAVSVSPGDELGVDMTWTITASEPVTMVVSLVSPAEARHGVNYVLSSTEQLIEPEMHVSLQIPDDSSRGVYLLEVQVLRMYEECIGEGCPERFVEGQYAGVVRVEKGASAQGMPVLAEFTEMTLHTLEAEQSFDTELKLKLSWSTPGTLNNWTHSYRLLNVNGEAIAYPESGVVQLDIEPGYGYLPTTLWTPGELVTDYVTLKLPEGLAPGDYILRIIAYQRNGLAGGELDIPVSLTVPTLYDLRNACCEQMRKGKTILCERKGMALLSLDVPQSINEGEDLTVYAQWNAIESPQSEVQAAWELRDTGGNVVATTSGSLAVGSQSASWPRFTWVHAPVTFDLPTLLSGGTHTLHLTLTGGGDSDSCTLEKTIEIVPRPREFDVPDLKNAQNAVFGETIRLLGSDVQHDRKNGTLDLTLWWQAESAPTVDYKRFVHVYDPETEQMLVQDDAMPRDWTYPTTWWQAGEVVSETLTLDISAASAGSYAIGVGWYDPATIVRLPVTESDSISDRVTLEQNLEIR